MLWRTIWTWVNCSQLWQCLVPWCSIWKGTAQDCVDHVRLRHQGGLSVKASTLGKCFPPWTVARKAWNDTLKPSVSGIATDNMLFSQHGIHLVHRFRCMGVMCLSCLICPTSRTGPVLRPTRRPNMARTPVLSLIRRLFDRLYAHVRHPSYTLK